MRLGLLASALASGSVATAREAPRVEMDPLGLYLPVAHAAVGLLGRPLDDPELRLSGSLRGGRVSPHATVGHTAVSAHLALDGLRLRAFRFRTVIWRLVGESQPLPAAWDVHIAPLTAAHLPELGVERLLAIRGATAEAGFFLPALRTGDLDARAVAGLSLLGARHQVYVDRQLKDFAGVDLGGVSGELALGVRAAPGFTAGAFLQGETAWSLGWSDGLSVVTEATVGTGVALTLNHGARLVAALEYDNIRDPANGASFGAWHGVAELRVPY